MAADHDMFCGWHGLGPARWATLQAARELLRRSALERSAERSALESPPGRAQLPDGVAARPPGRKLRRALRRRATSGHRALELFRGTLAQTAVYPREVARQALRLNAAAVIFAHNHPSGVAEPSTADRMLTDALKSALAQIDVAVLDHVIVAANQCVSFAERGLL